MATAIQEHIAHSPGLDTASADLAEKLRASTVEVRNEGHGNGSGVIWQADGLIVTNDHVVRAEQIEVVLADGRALPAQVVSRNRDRDLAALRVQARDLPAATIGDSDALRVGQLVLAMGNPLGIKGALSVGIVHSVAAHTASGAARWIHADLSLLPGNSGGPMVDVWGRVIGINSMVAGGLGLAVPSNVVQRFLAGKTRPAFLGVQTQAVAFPTGFAGGLNQETGLMVLSLVEGSPAVRSGLLPGDILVTAGRTPLREPDDLLAALRESTVGTPLPLAIVRAGRTHELIAILGERATETQ